MSDTKATRSNKSNDKVIVSIKPSIVPASRKVYFIDDTLLPDKVSKLNLERFFHPGKGLMSLFVTSPDKVVMEVLEHAEPRRSWLINNSVCSNGRIYMSTPVDTTFLALHQIRKHCTQKALAVDSIHDESDETVQRLMTMFVSPEQLRCIADEKSAGDLHFYKYNDDKAMAWLALKTRRVAAALKRNNIYCGYSAVSQNYDKSGIEEALESDLLRAASEIVGSYIDLELYDHLISYLAIPIQKELNEEKQVETGKRKSLKLLNENENKKIKLNESLKERSSLGVSLDTSTENDNSVDTLGKLTPTPFKERSLTAKEKALAKGAKGTKSIASFFKK